MSRFRTGVVIGKFYPPHQGHHYLINTALARCDRVAVLVCWKPEQTVPIDVRVACLREEHPTAEIIAVADRLADDDTPGWAAETIRILGYAPEAVFTSEAYGDPYAAAMGSVHVSVDPGRMTVPCSGTLVRSRPLAHLDCLAPAMRAYYVPRVCVLGAESTGTTTLARALAAHYATAWVPEYGREYCAEKWRQGYDDAWTTEEFVHIAAEQSRREDAAARGANRVLICDTDAFATGLWHERYLGVVSPAVAAIAAPRRYALTLLTGDEIPFVQDGLRDGEQIRHAMHDRFVEMLTASGRRWALLRGPHAARLARAIALIDALVG